MLLDKSEGNALQSLGTVRIKVVGVGGAGVNAIKHMAVSKSIPGVELLAVNTDVASLEGVHGVKTLVLGAQATRGLGAGGNPETGRKAAEEAVEELRGEMAGVDLVFITAGMGGGTGTGAAPVVAALAQEAGALTVGVVTTPFQFEGTRRKTAAFRGLASLRRHIDTLIVVSNQHLASSVKKNTPIQAAFEQADDVVTKAILTVSQIINIPGDVNVDFADVRSVVKGGGLGLMGMGRATGDGRLLQAAKAALANPLVNATPHGAGGVLFFISAGSDVTLAEVTEAGSYIAGLASSEAQIFFGLHTRETTERDEDVEVMIIATRLPTDGMAGPPPVTDPMEMLRATVPIYEAKGEGPAFRLPPM